MAKKRDNDLLILGALVVGGLLLGGKMSTTPAVPSGGQQPIAYWFNPTSGTLLYSPGIEPPAAGFRPASEAEINAQLWPTF